MTLKIGFYFVKFKGDTEITVGYYNDGTNYIDYQWQVIGSDESYNSDEIEIIKRIEEEWDN